MQMDERRGRAEALHRLGDLEYLGCQLMLVLIPVVRRHLFLSSLLRNPSLSKLSGGTLQNKFYFPEGGAAQQYHERPRRTDR